MNPAKSHNFPQKCPETSKISSERSKIEFRTPDLPQDTQKSHQKHAESARSEA